MQTPQHQVKAPDQTQRKLRLAIIGLGKYATGQIMPNLKETARVELAGLVSGHPAKARKLAAQYGVPEKNIYTYENFDSIRDNKDIDAVYIILPNSMHAEYAIRAAKAGKHVLCEKPMATSVEDCKKMIEACEKAGVKLMIGYRAHFDPHNLKAIEKIQKGELGKLVQITADHGRVVDPKVPADKWRVEKALAGGGSLMDIGIYSMNAACYLTGEEPVEVSARWSTDRSDPRFKEVEDLVHWTLRFPSGVLASCTTSYSYQDVKRYRAFGQKGWLDLDPATDYKEHKMVIGTEEGEQKPRIDEGNQFAGQMEHFADAVLDNKPIKTPGEMGLRDVRYMMAIYKAAETGTVQKV